MKIIFIIFKNCCIIYYFVECVENSIDFLLSRWDLKLVVWKYIIISFKSQSLVNVHYLTLDAISYNDTSYFYHFLTNLDEKSND